MFCRTFFVKMQRIDFLWIVIVFILTTRNDSLFLSLSFITSIFTLLYTAYYICVFVSFCRYFFSFSTMKNVSKWMKCKKKSSKTVFFPSLQPLFLSKQLLCWNAYETTVEFGFARMQHAIKRKLDLIILDSFFYHHFGI